MEDLQIAPYAEQVLRENYNRSVLHWEDANPEYDPYTIAEWCALEADSDPDFYRWIFADCDIEDFGNNLSDEQIKIASDFFDTL